MIYNTRNRSNDITESQKEKKDVLMLMQEEVKLDCPIYSKQTNKMWSLKSLVMLKCGSRTVAYMQYNKSESQALF